MRSMRLPSAPPRIAPSASSNSHCRGSTSPTKYNRTTDGNTRDDQEERQPEGLAAPANSENAPPELRTCVMWKNESMTAIDSYKPTVLRTYHLVS